MDSKENAHTTARGVMAQEKARVLGHASEMVTLTIYNHWEGELRAAADTMDLMLEKISQNENEEASVRK